MLIMVSGEGRFARRWPADLLASLGLLVGQPAGSIAAMEMGRAIRGRAHGAHRRPWSAEVLGLRSQERT
jgi:hypothetical protein